MMMFIRYFWRIMWICLEDCSGVLENVNAQIGVFVDR